MGFPGGAIWLVCDLMLVWLLGRAWRVKILTRYPFFFGYVGFVLCMDLVRLYLELKTSPRAYEIGYWISEFFDALAGFGVTWQIYATILAPYGGVRRMARAVLSVFFALVLAKALVELTGNPLHNLGPTTVELERNLRFVQALLLMLMATLVVHYALPMGRNARSMLAGYAFYVGCMVIALSLRSQWGDGFQRSKDLVDRLGYITALLVWCGGMWSYSRDPAPEALIETDYDQISAQTSRAFGRLRQHVTQSWRI
jgi:hypothetical protein